MTAKKATQRQGFKTNEFIVYPAHGVGQIVAIEEAPAREAGEVIEDDGAAFEKIVAYLDNLKVL